MTILGIDLEKSNERDRLVLTPVTSSGGGTGSPGPEGPAGPQGVQGVKGDTGAPGPQGIPGEKGDSGAQGVQGVPGPQGPQGSKGDTGAQGAKGDTGAQGAQGIQGAKGDTGSQGIRGGRWYHSEADNPDPANVANPIEGDIFLYPESRDFFRYESGAWAYGGTLGAIKGDTGAQGPQGIQGPKGDTGATGPKGDTGAQGIQGVQGPKGDTGATGAQGPAGPAGGSSAAYTDILVPVMSDGQSFTARKFAGSNLVVWFGQFTNNTGASIAAGTTLGTIPEGVRPRANMRMNLVSFADGAITGRIVPGTFVFNFTGSWSAGSTIHVAGVSYIAEG